MKIHTISHKNAQKERKNDVPISRHNKDKKYHPFIDEREYVRALNATKIERLLAKPFVRAFTYHKEGIMCVAKNPHSDVFASSSFNGQVFVWDLKAGRSLAEINLKSCSQGLCFIENGVVVSEGSTVHRYNHTYSDVVGRYEASRDVNTLSFHNDLAVGTISGVEIFDVDKKAVKSKYGRGNVASVSFNTVLDNLLAFTEDQHVVLADHRINQEFLKLRVGTRSNCVKFNPVHAQIFASGNEDSNLYFHDIRYTDRPLCTFNHHMNSIATLDFDAFGSHITTGSHDKTIRIFDIEERRCKDVYYNTRMHNVTAVRYSNDSHFIISGSDDGSLRVWKSESSKKLGPLTKKEKDALNFSHTLKEKFKDFGEIKRIRGHRFLPKYLKTKIKISVVQKKAQQRKRAKAMEKKRQQE